MPADITLSKAGPQKVKTSQTVDIGGAYYNKNFFLNRLFLTRAY